MSIVSKSRKQAEDALSEGKAHSRRQMSRLHISKELRLIVESIAYGDGYTPDNLHYWLYGLLKECRGAELIKALDLLHINPDELEEGVIPPD